MKGHKKSTSVVQTDLLQCKALVIDSHSNSRSMLTTQLRDFGIGKVVACARVLDARTRLENNTYDVVLCEQHFNDSRYGGQDLLDDLRRSQLLPFATVFIMVTGEAVYSKVAEAAESALDGYLLKPYSQASLNERIGAARFRKMALQDIFVAIDAGDFARAAALCVQRFQNRDAYWLYAARIGAELLMRLQKYDTARKLFEAVIAAKALPWARLGVARAQLDSGQIGPAVTTLQSLVGAQPDYADAYDVLGQAQVDGADFEAALNTYKTAATMTTSSVTRVQKHGMMAFYMGRTDEAHAALLRATALGLSSKMFDGQSLVLLALMSFQRKDRKLLLRCRTDMRRMLEKTPENARLQRLMRVIDSLTLIDEHQLAQALELVRAMLVCIGEDAQDFETCCNLLSLLACLAERSIRLDEVEEAVDRIGMRFCTTRALSELLASAAQAHAPYAQRIRECQTRILGVAEKAVAQGMGGHAAQAIEQLVMAAEKTSNTKLIDMAHSALQRYAQEFSGREEWARRSAGLRQRFGGAAQRAALGRDEVRQPGGLSLRVAVPAAAPAVTAAA
jgi:CheY-like chemotaxis protein